MTTERAKQPPPLVVSMILADCVHKDPTTGKHYILGTYSAILNPTFPAVRSPMYLYATLTEVHGPTEVRVRIIDMDELRPPVYNLAATINVSDPNQLLPLVCTMPVVVFPEPGLYRIQLFGNDELLRELRLAAVLTSRPHSPHEESS